MKTTYLAFAVAAIALLGTACESEQKVRPASGGQRGESCLARNDCGKGLACLNGTCSRNDFPIEPEAKHCDVIECSDDADCCGDRPREAPAKCDNRMVICDTPSIPDCDFFDTCTSDVECNGGSCGTGNCSWTGTTCEADGECQADFCSGGFCTLSSITCVQDADCTRDNSCVGRSCDCSNPLYDPGDPICYDSECTDLCTLRCEEEQCVFDTSCEEDLECQVIGLDFCEGSLCVECRDGDDCDDDESCTDGFCQVPCTVNEECPLFHECDSGECVESGCKDDIECIYFAWNNPLAEDARLAECLPSDEDPDIKECKVPCENDGACGSDLQVCEDGYCKFIGCDTDEQCRALTELQNEEVSDGKPYVSRAVCRE